MQPTAIRMSIDFLKGKVSPWKQAYYKWRSNKSIPFRKKFFVGYDLDGNTFWEFQNYNDPARMRRIVEYRIPQNYVDYRIPPQWVQWLRHNRPSHPSLEELWQDQQRQDALKGLIRDADQRWKSIPLKKDFQARNDSVQTPGKINASKEVPKEDGEYQPEGWNPSAKR